MAGRSWATYINCARCGGSHWGAGGAAGILLVRRDNSQPGNPATHIVMQHRADTNSWAIPGGARDSGESWRQTALREAWEEVSLPLNCTQGPNPLIELRGEVTTMDHGGWKYVTVIADVLGAFQPKRPPGDVESFWVGWVPIDQVGVRGGKFFPLMPAFWEGWETLRARVDGMNQPIPAPVPATTAVPAPVDQPILAETGEPVPPTRISGGMTATTSSPDAPVPDPSMYHSGAEDFGTERDWLAAQEDLCLWFIPAMP